MAGSQIHPGEPQCLLDPTLVHIRIAEADHWLRVPLDGPDSLLELSTEKQSKLVTYQCWAIHRNVERQPLLTHLSPLLCIRNETGSALEYQLALGSVTIIPEGAFAPVVWPKGVCSVD